MNRIAATTLTRPMASATFSRSATLARARMYSTPAEAAAKPKLRFRFGLRDVPTELYPIGFVVGVALFGAGIAVAKHFSVDDLRLKPNAKEVKQQ